MSKLRLRIFDGSRKPFSERARFLVTIIDGNKHRLFRDYIEANEQVFSLPFFDGLGDNYTVIVWADGYKQAGYAPVYLSDEYEKTLDLMLVPDDPDFSFAAASNGFAPDSRRHSDRGKTPTGVGRIDRPSA